jgi:hypothetical protein
MQCCGLAMSCRIKLFEEHEKENRYSQFSMEIDYENYISIESCNYDFKFQIASLDEY